MARVNTVVLRPIAGAFRTSEKTVEGQVMAAQHTGVDLGVLRSRGMVSDGPAIKIKTPSVVKH
jgi:hypothetical protein